MSQEKATAFGLGDDAPHDEEVMASDESTTSAIENAENLDSVTPNEDQPVTTSQPTAARLVGNDAVSGTKLRTDLVLDRPIAEIELFKFKTSTKPMKRPPILPEAFVPKYLAREFEDQPSLAEQFKDREKLLHKIEDLIREHGWITQEELENRIQSPPVSPKTIPVKKKPTSTTTLIYVSRPHWSKGEKPGPLLIRPPNQISKENPNWIGNPSSSRQPTATTEQTDQPITKRVPKRKRLLNSNILGEQARNMFTSLYAETMETEGFKRIETGTPPRRPANMYMANSPIRPLGRQPRPGPPKEYKQYDSIPPDKNFALRDAARNAWPNEKYYYREKSKGTMKLVDRILAGSPINDLRKQTNLPTDEMLHRVCMLASTSEKVLDSLGIDRAQLQNITGRYMEGNGEEIGEVLQDQKKHNLLKTSEEFL